MLFLVNVNNQQKHQKSMWKMFKGKNKDTRMLITFFCIFNVNFEHTSHLFLVFYLLHEL